MIKRVIMAVQNKVRKSISKGPTASLTAVGVPSFKNKLLGRNDEIASLIENLRELGETPEKGFLLVTGPPGVGKTSLVAHVLKDETIGETLASEYHIHVVIWLNCAKYKTDKFSPKQFTERVAELARYAAGLHPPPGAFPNFATVDHFFERQKRRRVLFVLDNVPLNNRNLLEFMRGRCCCLISEDESAAASNQGPLIREPSFQVKPLPDEIIASGFFDVDLKIGLGTPKLGELVKNCRGSPLLANLIMGRFKMERSIDNYRSIFDNIARHGDKLNSAAMFNLFADKMTQDQLGRFCSFLFYGIEIPISPVDLAILWGSNSAEVAESHCREFEAMSLITRVDPLEGNNEKFDHFVLHQSLRKSAYSPELNKKFKVLLDNLGDSQFGGALLLALKVTGIAKVKDQNFDRERNLLRVVQKIVSQERAQLWERLIAKPVVVHHIYDKYSDTLRMQDPSGRTALLLACKIGNFDTIKFVQEKYHDAIKMADKKTGRLPLSWAIVSHAPLQAVEFLYEKYPDAVKIRDGLYGQLPLSLAVEYGRYDVVKFLHEKFDKAVQMEDALGRGPLSIAAQIGRLDLVKFLFEKYKEAVESTLPLRLAAEYGHLPVVRFLHSQYPQAAIVVDEEGLMPADRASINGHNDVVEFLLTL